MIHADQSVVGRFGDVDFLAVVSRPDFPSGNGPVGDYYGFQRLIERNPSWDACVLELNSPGTEIDWHGDGRSSALFESCLDALPVGWCLNRPSSVRATNNKLVQFEKLSAAGFTLPETRVCAGFPVSGPLADEARLVSKNVSEGGWRSPTEFSPAHVVGRQDPGESWPIIWQRPIISTQWRWHGVLALITR